MRSLKEIWAYAFETNAEPPKIPSPDELALVFASALMSSGNYDPTNYSAAVEAAWWAVPEFYRGRILWQTTIYPLVMGAGPMSPQEPDMSAAEARAYVAGEAQYRA